MTEFLRVFVTTSALIGSCCLVPWLIERRGRIAETFLRSHSKASW